MHNELADYKGQNADREHIEIAYKSRASDGLTACHLIYCAGNKGSGIEFHLSYALLLKRLTAHFQRRL